MYTILQQERKLQGRFSGCKLHLVIDIKGEMVNTILSSEHITDIKMLKAIGLCKFWSCSDWTKEKFKLQEIYLADSLL